MAVRKTDTPPADAGRAREARTATPSERRPEFRTTSDITLKRLYTPDDIAALDYERDLGVPGEYPFTRGVQPTMYRGRLWTMRQYAGFGTAEESNRRYRYLLDHGTTGLSVAFDLPTQMGRDSDHPLAGGEAGCTAAQELGFTLANGIAYVDAAVRRGLDVDQFGARLSFFFNVHNDFLEEIAKFRAARRMWAAIMRDRFGAREPRALMLRFHAQTAGSSLTAQQPDNNIVRTAVQALAAVLGGCQSLHTN